MLRGFAFFGKALSRRAGEKCCPYGQNGQPLTKEFVQKFLASANDKVRYWRPSEDCLRLRHAWYFADYLQAAAFTLEIAKLDSRNVLKQKPDIALQRKELLTIELFTPLLGGLSQADLELAVLISLLPGEDYHLTPVKDERNYRAEMRRAKLDEATARVLSSPQQR